MLVTVEIEPAPSQYVVPYVRIKHQTGHARIIRTALELRPHSQGYQLHVMHIERCRTIGYKATTSKGVYLTLSESEGQHAQTLGIPCRERTGLSKAWKPGTLAIAGQEETLAQLRRGYAIHKVTVTHTATHTNYKTGEPYDYSWTALAHRLTHILSGESLYTARKRKSCEGFVDVLEAELPELSDIVDLRNLPTEMRTRFEHLAETWRESRHWRS